MRKVSGRPVCEVSQTLTVDERQNDPHSISERSRATLLKPSVMTP